MNEHRFVFIGGLHRSGTSLLFQCLREHPMISGFRNTGVPEDEGQHLQSVYSPAMAFGGPGEFGFHPKAALDERSVLVSDANRDKLFAEWSRYWDVTKPVLVEKSPPNLVRTRFLQALFPNSWFITLIRHPIVVALATQKWSRTSLDSLVEHWLVCHERFQQDRPSLRRQLILKYEDFVANPQEVLTSVYSFLELPGHPNCIEVDPQSNDRYMASWRRTQQTPAGAEEAQAIRDEFEERVSAFGYTL